MTTCFAHFTGSSLVIGNDLIERHFVLNSGQLRTTALIDKQADHTWTFTANTPDICLPGEPPEGDSTDSDFRGQWIDDDLIVPPHLRVTVAFRLGELQLRRVFRIYDHVPAIASDLYLRGHSRAAAWRTVADTRIDSIEDIDKLHRADFRAPSIDHLAWPHPHIALKAVQFFDRTDQRNTLVRSQPFMPYNVPALLAGNILLGCDPLARRGFAMLKEAPCSDVQLANPEGDFLLTSGGVRCVGIGLDPADLHPTHWCRAYGCVIALAAADEHALLDALRLYQHQLRPHRPDRDFQLMVNTWGDRSRDARMSESFILHELDAAAKLGVTHLQLDDGWQTGISPNSSLAGGSFDNLGLGDDYWTPHPARFPHGLQPLTDKAELLGIQLGLWFGPLKADHYADWQRDADTLIDLHRRHGVRVFKIDMVDIPCKVAEENLRRMFDKVVTAAKGDVCFNLDTTAGQRYGYHWFREFGHTFVENRYTDWANYYPHRTLRNLWSLSRYMPPQTLQFEFLNKWRNADKYGSDPLAPAHVPFAYCFALTMMAQPLAWFEASGLPPEAFDIAPLIATYRKHQPAIHAGRIHPIGHEPDGTIWTGFQSVTSPDSGYLLVLRERNDKPIESIKLHISENRQITCTAIAGDATDFTAETNADSAVQFALPAPFTFGLWCYELR